MKLHTKVGIIHLTPLLISSLPYLLTSEKHLTIWNTHLLISHIPDVQLKTLKLSFYYPGYPGHQDPSARFCPDVLRFQTPPNDNYILSDYRYIWSDYITNFPKITEDDEDNV